MGLVETEAIILRNLKLGEADKIVVALTHHEGIVRGVARGARRLKSKFGASLEPFTVLHLTFFEKETRELVSFTNTEIRESYFELTRNDTIFLTLEYLAGLIIEFAPLRAPDERFYRMMKACLEAIREEPSAIISIARYCEIWTLKIAGFLPDLSHCGMCRREFLKNGSSVILDAHNTLKCRQCSDGPGITISHQTIQRLNAALKSRPRDWTRAVGTHTTDATIESEIRNTLHALLSRALEREPKFRSSHLT
jgi:DNA repair protein RecO (recombination protein O)